MKKIIMLMLVLITASVTAQEHGNRKHKKEHLSHFEEFSPEEIAQLKTKKLTLSLDLSDEQQKKINAIELKNAKSRRLKIDHRKNTSLDERLTKEERLTMVNERLDKQIAQKAEIKNILNEVQFEKWEKLQEKKHLKQRHKKRHSKKHKRK